MMVRQVRGEVGEVAWPGLAVGSVGWSLSWRGLWNGRGLVRGCASRGDSMSEGAWWSS